MPDYAGEGNLSCAGLEPGAHTVLLLTAIRPVAAAGPVVKQHRERVILGSGDGFCLLVNYENAVGISLIVR